MRFSSTKEVRKGRRRDKTGVFVLWAKGDEGVLPGPAGPGSRRRQTGDPLSSCREKNNPACDHGGFRSF